MEIVAIENPPWDEGGERDRWIWHPNRFWGTYCQVYLFFLEPEFEPLVHYGLKPANILLDRNYACPQVLRVEVERHAESWECCFAVTKQIESTCRRNHASSIAPSRVLAKALLIQIYLMQAQEDLQIFWNRSHEFKCMQKPSYFQHEKNVLIFANTPLDPVAIAHSNDKLADEYCAAWLSKPPVSSLSRAPEVSLNWNRRKSSDKAGLIILIRDRFGKLIDGASYCKPISSILAAKEDVMNRAL
ncbi:conserved hypothetical protein [Ricinus communis]|uniref:Protein kinase domain-containing protein n=1 Tax=Ricinus communis TaxID=3988 RepID=B9RH91_RICCO|nr:conserved hypothetical protein [Ricinus communis]